MPPSPTRNSLDSLFKEVRVFKVHGSSIYGGTLNLRLYTTDTAMMWMRTITSMRGRLLAARCEMPAHIAQYPFDIVSQRGVSYAFCLVFIGYCGSIAEIPLL